MRYLLLLSAVILAFYASPARVIAQSTVPTTQPLLADDDEYLCNHTPPKGVPNSPIPDVRCKDAVTEGKILLFARGSKASIDLPIQNDRKDAIAANYALALVDRDGKSLHEQTEAVTLAPGTATPVTFAIDTSDLKFGVYSLMLHVTAGGQALTDREYYLGVRDDAIIPKSPDGQFLYGLDPNYGPVVARDPIPAEPGKKARQGQFDLLPWIDAMGVDILRAAGCTLEINHTLHPERLAWITDDYPTIRRHNLRVMGMASPPFPNSKAPDGGFLPADMEKWTTLCEETARKVPDMIYWELGNEPDLGYPSMDRYVEIYEQTYQAIKRGNPNAIIMNGAITFFGSKGPANSKRLIELVKPDLIDVIAYHAHGPGSGAERRIYEQVHAAQIQYGKTDKPNIDTESGMFVSSKKQEDMQAWMVVQKQVYAQSVGVKLLMTFRLHAFRSERGWGLLREDQEPNPAILSYRTMTEHLKGLAFQNTLSLGKPYAEGYSFAQPNGPQRACLLWSNQQAFYNVYLKVADSAAQARNLRRMDIYGNVSPADVSADGVVRMEVTQAPVYLLWDAADAKTQVAVTHSMLQTPDMATIVPDGDSPLDVQVANASNTDLTATISAAIAAPGQAAITPDKQKLVIPAKQTLPVHFSMHWNPAGGMGLTWPTSWRVYSDAKATDIDLAKIDAMPHEIKGNAGRTVIAVNSMISLLRTGELPTEKRAGFVFGTVQSDRDQVIQVGCAADFWMEFRLNGKVVCSTLAKGNGSTGVSERIVELQLNKGDNLLAFEILSGKGGWSLSLASPTELPALLDPRKPNNCVNLTLESGGKVLSLDRLSLQPVRRVAPAVDGAWTDSAEQVIGQKPDFVLDNSTLTNLWDKQQDRTKWWQGPNDLSAKAWLRADPQHLYLTVWALDDKDVAGTDLAKLSQSDSLRFGLSVAGNSSVNGASDVSNLYSIGRLGGKAVVYKDPAPGAPAHLVEGSSAEISARVERVHAGTLYRVAFDRSVIGNRVFRLNFMISDNDDGYLKQFIELSSGLGSSQDVSLWQQFILTNGK